MKKIKFLFLSLLLLSMVTLVACSDDDDENQIPSKSTIVDVAKSNPNFSILVEALDVTGLDEALANSSASLTVFAPTNQAFADLLTELGVNGLNDVSNETLSNILLYHVLGETKMASSITTGYYNTLFDGAFDDTNVSLYINMESGMINKRATITETDLKTDNGVIHVIDKVILPQTIVDIAVNNSSFGTLAAALTKAELLETLSGDGPFTVFAPTDDAFDDLFQALGVSGIEDLSKETLTPILLAHVVRGNVTSGDLASGDVQTLNENKKIAIDISNGVKIDEDINVTLTDVQGTNGVVHVIDKVIVPDPPIDNTIVDIAQGNDDFSILVSALVKADLVDALDDEEAAFTVFAPTNQAFSDLLTELGAGSLDDVPTATLKNILLYHVLGQSKMAADISTGYFSTLAKGTGDNTKLSMYIDMENSMIDKRAKIKSTDIEADNGVIHVIDKVILPQTIVDIAVNNDSFSTLAAALTKAELVETLSGNGPFTVFVPTDAAFNNLFEVLGVSGIEDLSKEVLTPILLAHVVSGNVTSGDLASGDVQTLNENKKIAIDISNGVKIDEDINVTLADVQGTNGVVHVIDKVIEIGM